MPWIPRIGPYTATLLWFVFYIWVSVFAHYQHKSKLSWMRVELCEAEYFCFFVCFYNLSFVVTFIRLRFTMRIEKFLFLSVYIDTEAFTVTVHWLLNVFVPGVKYLSHHSLLSSGPQLSKVPSFNPSRNCVFLSSAFTVKVTQLCQSDIKKFSVILWIILFHPHNDLLGLLFNIKCV